VVIMTAAFFLYRCGEAPYPRRPYTGLRAPQFRNMLRKCATTSSMTPASAWNWRAAAKHS
jgi:hypothetical protein